MRKYTRQFAVALAIGLVLTGCNAAKPTVIPQLTPTPSSTFEPAETPTDVAIATDTPLATATPAVTPTPTPTEGPTPTPAPIAGDPTTCTYWSINNTGTEFTNAAKAVKFNVYCGVMPSGWHISNMTWSQPKGTIGQLVATYANKSKTQTVTISEGNFCGGCAWVDVSNLGSASFANMTATLKLRATGQYALYVNPGATLQYQMTSTGISQATFVSIAAALVNVPKA